MIMPDFEPISGLQDISIAQSGKLRCAAIRLADDTYCLYSPLPGLLKGKEGQTEPTMKVSALLAPNHYHNRGLTEHVQHYPNAHLMCSSDARPRLNKVTGLEFDDVEWLSDVLPPQMRVLRPEGLKTGEVWIEIDCADGVAWLVTDAFSSITKRGAEFSDTATLLRTFPSYGVSDRAVYQSWVRSRLSCCSLPFSSSPVTGNRQELEPERKLEPTDGAVFLKAGCFVQATCRMAPCATLFWRQRLWNCLVG